MNTLYRKTGRKAILSDCFLPFAQRLFYQSLDINIDTLTVFKENCTHFIMRYFRFSIGVIHKCSTRVSALTKRKKCCIISLLSKSGSRGHTIFRMNEESPSSIGQGAGEIPVEATLRKVQQK